MIKFGWAETDITPERKIALDGEFFERATNEVETPITITALAVESNGMQMIYCSCDVVVITEELVKVARERMKSVDVDKNNLIVGCVHIHNSYTYRRKSPLKKSPPYDHNGLGAFIPEDCEYIPEAESTDVMTPDEAFEFLADAIAKTADKAWENRAAGGFAAGFGRAAVGMNRRACYTDGSAKMWGDVDTSTIRRASFW